MKRSLESFDILEMWLKLNINNNSKVWLMKNNFLEKDQWSSKNRSHQLSILEKYVWYIRIGISWVNSILLNLVVTLKGMKDNFFQILFCPTFSWFSSFRVQVSIMLFWQLIWILHVHLGRFVIHTTSWKDLKFNEKLWTKSTSCYHFTLNKDLKSNNISNDVPWDLFSNYIYSFYWYLSSTKKFQLYTSYGFFNEPNPFWRNFQRFNMILHIN